MQAAAHLFSPVQRLAHRAMQLPHTLSTLDANHEQHPFLGEEGGGRKMPFYSYSQIPHQRSCFSVRLRSMEEALSIHLCEVLFSWPCTQKRKTS